MEFWLDTIDLNAIQFANQHLACIGVTTNPSFFSPSIPNRSELISELLRVQSGPICLQVIGPTKEEMLKEAKELSKLSPRIIVKIPATREGFYTLKTVSQEGIPTLATAIFHPNQALIAAMNGASYVAPYLSHMSNAGIDAFGALQTILKLYNNFGLKTKILVASLRNAEQLLKCAEMGCHAVTMKDSLIQEFLEDHLETLEWVNKFSADSKKL